MGDLELDDDALLASLEAEGEVGRVQGDLGQDSGYGTFGESSTQSSRSSSIRNVVSAASSRWVGNNTPQHFDAGTPHFSLSGKHTLLFEFLTIKRTTAFLLFLAVNLLTYELPQKRKCSYFGTTINNSICCNSILYFLLQK